MFFGSFHWPIDESCAFWEVFFEHGGAGFGGGDFFVAFFQTGADPKDAAPLVHLFFESCQEGIDFGIWHGCGVYGFTAGRHFVELRDGEVAEFGHEQGSWDWGCAHDEDIGAISFGGECGALFYAEAVLFVDDCESEVSEGESFAEEGVGTDGDFADIGGEALSQTVAFGGSFSPEDEFMVDAEALQDWREAFVVLAGEHFGRGHEGDLFAGIDDGEGGEQGDDGFSATDIALEESCHSCLRG